jgi:hypothetical protein
MLVGETKGHKGKGNKGHKGKGYKIEDQIISKCPFILG